MYIVTSLMIYHTNPQGVRIWVIYQPSLAWPTAFFRFSLGWREKGLVWFIVATRLGTPHHGGGCKLKKRDLLLFYGHTRYFLSCV